MEKESSDLLSASAVILNKDGYLAGCRVFTDGTNNATLTIYDNASAASGKVLDKIIVVGADYMGGVKEGDGAYKGIVARNGIYASISGTGATFIVHFASNR